MSKRNPEIRLLMKILAIMGFIVLLLLLGGYLFLRIRAPHLLQLAKGVEEIRIEIHPDSLASYSFIGGMNGCENIWLDTAGRGFYVTTLDGHIHYVDGPAVDSFALVWSFRAGTSVTGITEVSDSLLAAVVNRNAPEEWMSVGAAVSLVDIPPDSLRQVTANFPSANGLCADARGNLYFASSNFNFFDPSGNIYRMGHLSGGSYSDPEPLFEDAGLANGLYYDRNQDRIFFSNTIDGVFSFIPGQNEYRTEYRKMRFMEACDDLCTDISGNIWMTDPGYSTVKIFNPGTNRLVRFVLQGIGQTSSCRIRTEGEEEIIYITELKKEQKPFSQTFDGRGVLRISANELLGLVDPEVDLKK